MLLKRFKPEGFGIIRNCYKKHLSCAIGLKPGLLPLINNNNTLRVKGYRHFSEDNRGACDKSDSDNKVYNNKMTSLEI